MARQVSTTRANKPIPVIIGAGITEQWYFTHLHELLNLRLRIRPRYFGTENIYQLDKKIAQVINDGAIAICVFDTDTAQFDEAEKKKVEALKKKYEGKKNVILCDSLPSVEYWFLLHYEDTNRFFQNSAAVEKALKPHIEGYEKSESFLSKKKWVQDMLADDKLQTAIDRAKKYESEDGSYSNVYKAIERVMQKG